MGIKICHLTSVHDSTDVRVFRKECSSLAKKYDVYLVAKGQSREENNVKIIGIGDAPDSRLKRITRFTKAVYQKGLSLDCDIYQIHDPELLPVALKLKRKGKAVIYDSHELYYEQIQNRPYLNRTIRKVISFLYLLYERHVLKRIDAVIFPCLINGRNPFEGRCELIETIDNYPILDELFANYDENCVKTERSACYVGSISANRGVTNFIKAISKIGGVANIGGPFDTIDYEEELKKMPEFKSVNYHGVLNRDQVLQMLNSSIIGMANLRNVGQYNKSDNLPTKVYEYMSMGMPVILSKSPYNDVIMKKYKFGICVDPDDIDETARAMETIFSDKELQKEMGVNGRRAVKNYFNWSTEEKKLIELYEKILMKRRIQK